jgi:hypothetical protein
MTSQDISALFEWARTLREMAGSAGFPMDAVPASGELADFVGWAKGVSAGMGAFVSLPALSDGASFAEALAWARALDGTARGMGAALPPLPQG